MQPINRTQYRHHKRMLLVGSLLLSLMPLAAFVQIEKKRQLPAKKDQIYLKVLGIAQDGGYPQIGCQKSCCRAIKQGKESRKNVVSLGLSHGNKYWLFEATPDIGVQLEQMQEVQNQPGFLLPAGIFLSHAHIGHYSGLQFLGREALNAYQIPVFTMPRMATYLTNNGPWSQLLALDNISLRSMSSHVSIPLDTQISVTPILVPHRDEYSETIGFIIQSDRKKVLFVPDIDKWDTWNESIEAIIKTVDLALVDGTFFQDGELPNRNMAEVPHPFVEESLKQFKKLSPKEKSKICFIHFNHTNPLIKKTSPQKEQLQKKGYQVAEEGMRFTL